MLYGRPVTIYWHQPHNWPEFMCCRMLVDRGFPRDCVIFENWRASAKAIAFRTTPVAFFEDNGAFASREVHAAFVRFTTELPAGDESLGHDAQIRLALPVGW